jgi:hypothetical protein
VFRSFRNGISVGYAPELAAEESVRGREFSPKGARAPSLNTTRLGSLTAILILMPLPLFEPLPLSRARSPFAHQDWLFEIKWDGKTGSYLAELPRVPLDVVRLGFLPAPANYELVSRINLGLGFL